MAIAAPRPRWSASRAQFSEAAPGQDVWWWKSRALGTLVQATRARGQKRKENIAMSEARDKARNSTQGAKGKAKEAAGKATGNDRLRAKGKTDQAKSKVKKAGEKVKDRLR
jgi:uncharacterized protein YjbJ (UPF0337 family)